MICQCCYISGDYKNLPSETDKQLDAFPGCGEAATKVAHLPLWRQYLWEGGAPADVFLVTASAQVGQVLLNLPSRSFTMCQS